MAIDRTGINSLNAGAPDLRLEGDIASIQAIPIEIQKMILQYWIQQGSGSPADRIEDVPKEFRDNILRLFQQSSRGNTQMPSRGNTQMPSSPERSMSAYGGTARPTYTQSRKQRMAGGGITGLEKAKNLLTKNAPAGESLAFINPQEANLLKSRGGSGIMTASGVPSYISIFGYEIPGTGSIDLTGTDILDYGKKAYDFVTGGGKPAPDQPGMPQGSPRQINLPSPTGQPDYGPYSTSPIYTPPTHPERPDVLSVPESQPAYEDDPGFWTKLGQTIIPGGETGYLDKDISEYLGGGGGGGGGDGDGAWYDPIWDTAKKIGQTIIPGGDPGYLDDIPDSLKPYIKHEIQAATPGYWTTPPGGTGPP